MKTIFPSFFAKFSPLFMGIFLAGIFFLFSFFLTGQTMAGFGVDDSIKLADASGDVDLKSSLITMLNYFLGFLGIILVIIIVYAGFIIIMSQGEEEKLTAGRKMIIYAIIGVVVIFLSYTIVNFIGGVVDSGSAGGVTG